MGVSKHFISTVILAHTFSKNEPIQALLLGQMNESNTTLGMNDQQTCLS